jgi:N-acetylmuramoyl-L-alanine amidase
MNYVIIRRGEQRVFLSPGSREALVNGAITQLDAAPQLAAGYPLAPIKATVGALGASVGWDEESQTVLVWDGMEKVMGGL